MAANMSLVIEPMSRRDWTAVRSIYEQSAATGSPRLEYEASDWTTWDTEHLPACRLVARISDRLVAWGALKRASAQRVYRGVMDVAVYVGPNARRQGLGKSVLTALIATSEREGVWTLQAGIFADNAAGAALYGSCGFRMVGRRERIAQVDGGWADVLLFERRSPAVGTGTPHPPGLR
jgi:phosphinothricin acetyltransferase